MRTQRKWRCSCSLVSFLVGFCLGLGEIVYVFQWGSLASNCLQNSVRLEMMQTRSHDTTDSRRDDFDITDKNQGLSFNGTLKREKVRILCWVMTQEENLASKTQMIKDTWGKRCDTTLYFSSNTDHDFPTIGLDIPDGRRYLFLKTCKAFDYIHKHHFNDADWFLKTDDDTFVIVENLRRFLQDKNSSSPVYYGQIFHRYVRGGYNSGGAGYILGKEAVRRFVLNGPSQAYCKRKRGSEDVALGKWMLWLNVAVGSTKDVVGKERFNWHNGFSIFAGKIPEWVKRYVGNNRTAYEPSNVAISFHYINSGWMKVIDFIVYHLTVHGVL
ncbi:glycoprotein-N-acetylgalactosamine 3-beta-galactosyltransferase 1-like [Gigantopelta aegis]|uniref:glycoprotein-N-acetylgalactosamine 3-beta-galactosyltransferase 1-like n=1 Tax=Gigantopelta aegis TaxID=1735272 RepID=UPI001B8893F5|nr:glycoprotein-N-acetylgalactosamine 3-beta-galactosyltransferase 1-like [Gigantopelta aegis]